MASHPRAIEPRHVGLTLSLRCSACGRPAPAVGLDQPAACGCGQTTGVPSTLWSEVLDRADLSSYESTPGLTDQFELQASTGAAEATLLVGEAVCECGAALPLPEIGSTELVTCRKGAHGFRSMPVPMVVRESVPTALQVTRPEPPSGARFWVTFHGTPRAIREQHKASLEAAIKDRAAPLSVPSSTGPVSLQMSSYQIAKQAGPKKKERAPPWVIVLVLLTAGAGLAWYFAGQMRSKSRGALVEDPL